MENNLEFLHGEGPAKRVPPAQLPQQLFHQADSSLEEMRAPGKEARRTDQEGFQPTRKLLNPSCAGGRLQSRQTPKAFQESGMAACRVRDGR